MKGTTAMNKSKGNTVVEANERRSFGTLRLRGRIWWLRYRLDGKEHSESSGSSSKQKAEKLLNQRQAEFGLGMLTAPDVRKVGFGDLAQMLRDHYRICGLRSAKRMERALGHLTEAFGSRRAVSITTKHVKDYALDRLENGAAPATVNYDLNMLKKAFNLAIENGKLTSRPTIKTPAPRNARIGFFEPDDFRAVYDELPAYLQPIMQFAYLTGWRVRDEVLPLTWDRVDFRAGVVRLDPNSTKNGDGRSFPFDTFPELGSLLRKCREETTKREDSTSSVIRHVFHRNGNPIKDYYHAWRSACRRAATDSKNGSPDVIRRPHLMGRIAHDFRRTAVRNLVRAGVSERVAMDLTGHRTRAIFDRYNITNEADLRAGVTKLAALHDASGRESEGTKGGQSASNRQSTIT
jgi:integrase